MSTTEPTTEPTSQHDPAAPAPSPSGSAEHRDGDHERVRARRAEAKTLRGRAKDAEAEVEALRERVTGMQRGEVTRLAGQFLTTADDVFHDGTSAADFLDETGNVDPAAVQSACESIVADRPHWAKGYQAGPPSSRPRVNLPTPGASPNGYSTAQPSWRDVLGG